MLRAPRWGMICCLTLEWLALGVWFGGLLVLIGVVIPAVFNTFGGQELGGVFLTRTFEGYNHFVIGALAILLVGAWYRWWSEDLEVVVSSGELMLLLGMGVIAGVIILWLHPRVAELQAVAYATKEEIVRKLAFEAFFRVHLPVRLLYLVNLGLGILLTGMKVKRLLCRDGAFR